MFTISLHLSLKIRIVLVKLRNIIIVTVLQKPTEMSRQNNKVDLQCVIMPIDKEQPLCGYHDSPALDRGAGLIVAFTTF